jgi:GrpB-like predicted nucleotidyltransferase (UPF0157 family)
MNSLIEIVPYNEEWPAAFAAESELVKQALGANCILIHHIGSTSIPGLAAKPIIDMLPVVRDILKIDEVTNAMERIGYIAKGEYSIPSRRYFQKTESHPAYNVHVYAEGNPIIKKYLGFCDWLRSHPDDLEAYAKLKRDLAAQFPQDMSNYNQGKTAFITEIEKKAGAGF